MSEMGQIRAKQRWPGMSTLPLQADLPGSGRVGFNREGSQVNFLSGRPKLSIIKTEHGCPRVGGRYAGQTPDHVAEISKPPSSL